MASVTFSIIIPAYNVADYLSGCIDSIIKQAGDVSFECIIVNDGSTDNTGEIATSLLSDKKNFHYYEKENGGVSDTRNFAISKAVGEYIVFIDADDIISPNLLVFLDRVIKEKLADLIYYNFEILRTESINEKEVFSDDGILKSRSISKRELASKPNYPWARAAKRSLYANILYPIGLIYEDIVSTTLLNSLCQNPYIIENTLYGYRKRPNSLMTASAVKQLVMFETIKYLKLECKKNNIEDVYYHSAVVNLSRSALMSVYRIRDRKKFALGREMMWQGYEDIPLLKGICSYASGLEKLIFMVIKAKSLGLPLLWGFGKLINRIDARRNIRFSE
jgi:glycosyltransferase involved in cell wall biosynthesis